MYNFKRLTFPDNHFVNVAQLAIFVFVLVFVPDHVSAQTVLGTPGLMNIPTAEVRKGGTFDGGASLIQKDLQIDSKDYYTALYYINFSPFSFFDLSLRWTLLRCPKSDAEPNNIGFFQQDRSLTLRIQAIREREGKWWPSVLIGSNDFFSSHGRSDYANVYGVVTKHFPVKGVGTFSATAGYSKSIHEGSLYDGPFGGASFSPAFAPIVRVMGEYDTRGFNVGIGAQLFRHLNLTCFTREFKGVSATISYQYTITFKR